MINKKEKMKILEKNQKNIKDKKKNIWLDNRGVNTIEIVIILAVVVGIALIFRDKMITFAGDILEDVMSTETDVSPETIRSEGTK